MARLEGWVAAAGDILWGFPLVSVLMLTGLYFSVRLRMPQGRWIKDWLGGTLRRLWKKEEAGQTGEITPRQALCTALAGTMGTGNIIGVATAVSLGGAGAVVWMGISAIFGMMTKYAETVLSVKFRKKNREGNWVGGAMEYIAEGLKNPRLAGIFALFCVLASFGMGNMAQANAISDALGETFSWDTRWSAGGVVLVLIVVIFGGLKRIARVSEGLIPVLSVVYLLGGMVVIAVHGGNLPECLRRMGEEAFSLKSAAGGIGGSALAAALRYGVGRGVFSNEAGLGSSGMVYGAAEGAKPSEAGMWGIFELFLDTMVVCTVTALAILTAGTVEIGAGAGMVSAAFGSVFGRVGEVFVAVSVVLFAFASMLGWEYYGERGFCTLSGQEDGRGYRAIFLAVAFLGGVARLELVWNLSEIFNGLMALPNLYAIFRLRRVVLEEAGGKG